MLQQMRFYIKFRLTPGDTLLPTVESAGLCKERIEAALDIDTAAKPEFHLATTG